ncbi:MAG: DNA ligase D [Actinobacteria bacterium]|nr:DNA ligase D [Actinomycetota bacterium]
MSSPEKRTELKNLPGIKKEPMFSSLKPMIATLVDKPFDSKQWIYEIKWDGYRIIAICKNGKVSIRSRNNIILNGRFPAIVKSLEQKVMQTAAFDGEIVALDSEGKSSFQLLQNYLRTGRGILVYYIFDILYLDGFSLLDVELSTRKKVLRWIYDDYSGSIYDMPLNSALPGSNSHSKTAGKPDHPENRYGSAHIRVSDFIEDEGISFFKIAAENRLEGIIAKRKNSKYEPGTRSRSWLKIKTRLRQEVIICGYTEPKGRRPYIGSLVTGFYSHKRLVYTGLVGGGISEVELKDLYFKLTKIRTDTQPFTRNPVKLLKTHWVKPLLVAEVAFAEWTADMLMRQPVYLGLRIDKDPVDVIFEKPENYKINTSANSRKDPLKNTATGTGNLRIIKKNGNIINKKTIRAEIKVKLTHPDKIFWPEERITKKDLFDYYIKIAPFILPYVENRPQSLNRCPDGIYGGCFYQKDIDHDVPGWLQTEKIYSESGDKYIDYLICKDINSLLYMVNLGCIDMHPWSSRVNSLEKPDFAILDLDPLAVDFQEVIDVAAEAKHIFDNSGINAFCKTSGSKGIHIYIPLGAKYSYGQALDFIKVVAGVLNALLPEKTSLERSPEKRHGKVYLDCYQNRPGQTVASPYCIRPKKGVPVSTPLGWEELKTNFSPADFNIRNIFQRLEKKGDIWKGVTGTGINMKKCLVNIAKSYKN